jgi:predicted enzyme related to lactoylglutathione lyase
MSALRISYVTMFTTDLKALPNFYVEVFGLEEVAASRSDRYRELKAGDVMLGFPWIDAYANLNMTDQADPTGVRSMITFAAQGMTEVDTLVAKAAECGARLVKPPFQTDFGQYLAVLLDPEGNAIRIAAPAN